MNESRVTFTVGERAWELAKDVVGYTVGAVIGAGNYRCALSLVSVWIIRVVLAFPTPRSSSC